MLKTSEIMNYLSCDENTALKLETKALAYIRGVLGFDIEETEYLYETDRSAKNFYTPNFPITEIIDIKENRGTIFEPDFQAPGNYVLISNIGKILFQSEISILRVEYKAGYKPYVDENNKGNLPGDLKQAILDICEIYNFDTKGIKAETVDGDRTEFITPESRIKNSGITKILDKYKRYELVA